MVKEATVATDLSRQTKRNFNVIEALPMVEMWGLEPQTPYMRSNKSGSAKACYIRVFGPLSRFLPIFLPTENRVKKRLHDDLRVAANESFAPFARRPVCAFDATPPIGGVAAGAPGPWRLPRSQVGWYDGSERVGSGHTWLAMRLCLRGTAHENFTFWQLPARHLRGRGNARRLR